MPNDWSNDYVGCAVRDAFQKNVGFGKEKSVCGLADELGVSESAVKSWRDNGQPPTLPHFGLICRALPNVLNHWLVALGYAPTHRIGGPELATGEMLASLAATTYDLAEKWSDGKLCHQERADLEQELPKRIAELTQFHANLKTPREVA